MPTDTHNDEYSVLGVGDMLITFASPLLLYGSLNWYPNSLSLFLTSPSAEQFQFR